MRSALKLESLANGCRLPANGVADLPTSSDSATERECRSGRPEWTNRGMPRTVGSMQCSYGTVTDTGMNLQPCRTWLSECVQWNLQECPAALIRLRQPAGPHVDLQ